MQSFVCIAFSPTLIVVQQTWLPVHAKHKQTFMGNEGQPPELMPPDNICLDDQPKTSHPRDTDTQQLDSKYTNTRVQKQLVNPEIPFSNPLCRFTQKPNNQLKC